MPGTGRCDVVLAMQNSCFSKRGLTWGIWIGEILSRFSVLRYDDVIRSETSEKEKMNVWRIFNFESDTRGRKNATSDDIFTKVQLVLFGKAERLIIMANRVVHELGKAEKVWRFEVPD